MARDALSQAFSALADPTRRAILARLSKKEATVGELAAPFDMSMPAISNHLKVLENAGLIVREVDAQRRRCRLTPDGLQEAKAFMTEIAAFWEDSFGELDAFLARGDDLAAGDHTETETNSEKDRDDGPSNGSGGGAGTRSQS
jgi:DNA-binding transcriptional ArsR family regulator